MLDTFGEFPPELKREKLAEIIGMARAQQPDFHTHYANEGKQLLAAFEVLSKEMRHRAVMDFVSLAKKHLELRRKALEARGR
jgi:hypothetical protein